MTAVRWSSRLVLTAIGPCCCALVLALTGLITSPARAADVCAGHPSDASVVCVRLDDTVVDVCDRDPDGHRAYARVVTQASNPGFRSPYYDDNDSRPGCANVRFSSRVLSVAVCVQYEGCSAFKSTTPSAPPQPPLPVLPPPD